MSVRDYTERLEKELKAANRKLETARLRLQEVSQDRCQLQAKFNAIILELGPTIVVAAADGEDITVPASVVEELRKALYG